MRRVLHYIRIVLHVLAWPITGELNPRRMSSEQAKAELEMMARANRDQSR
ncbi:MAG TPA: hypothetical protein VFN33_07495 [Gaiellaceae bacterium]|nr:hypothetical protein [Gaiellaceae bacterium]